MVNIWTWCVPSSVFSLFILHSKFLAGLFFFSTKAVPTPDSQTVSQPRSRVNLRGHVKKLHPVEGSGLPPQHVLLSYRRKQLAEAGSKPRLCCSLPNFGAWGLLQRSICFSEAQDFILLQWRNMIALLWRLRNPCTLQGCQLNSSATPSSQLDLLGADAPSPKKISFEIMSSQLKIRVSLRLGKFRHSRYQVSKTIDKHSDRHGHTEYTVHLKAGSASAECLFRGEKY